MPMVLAKINIITIPLLPINDHCSPLGHMHWLAPCRFEIAGRLLSKTRTGIILAIQTKPRPQLKAGTKELAIDQGQGPMVYSSLEPFGRHFFIWYSISRQFLGEHFSSRHFLRITCQLSVCLFLVCTFSRHSFPVKSA